MRLPTWGVSAMFAAALLALAMPVRAHADDQPATRPGYRVVIDRVDLEPAAIGGQRLRVELSALALQGQLLDLTDPKSIKLLVGTSELKAPYALGTYGATRAATAIVIVVQGTLEYSEVLPIVTEALDQTVLAALDEQQTQIAILSYGEATGTGKLGTVKSARTKITQLQHDGSAGDPALLETIERALLLLKKAKTEPEGRPLRKMIVVIGDGRDRNGDRERVTKVGQRAAAQGVRIHAFAFSPSDVRRPLLLLGELSKRSFGTFRWLQRGKSDSWTPAFEQLRDEITRQYVLTYFVGADDDVAGKKLKVQTIGRTQAISNEVKIPDSLCNGEVCNPGYCATDRCVVPQAATGRGVLGWVLLVGGIALGAIVLLGLVGYVISKRQQPIAPPMPGVPGSVPPVVKAKKVKQPKGQPVAPAPVVSHVVAPAAGRAVPHLMILNGPRAGERIPLRHGFMIGKAPGCDLMIEDGFTSGHHAQIGIDHGGFCRLYDRGSTNGTFVNGVRVTEHALEHGASLRIGSTELRFLTQ